MASKNSKKHPYAAIEHRVIDSDAFADLTPSAAKLLVLVVRQLTADNNGRLQASYSYTRKHGICSEHTLSRALGELISHGFIYRTRSGGYQQGAAQYAVTWLPITKREGLFLNGFKACAWRDWEPDQKKSPPSKLQTQSCRNGMRTSAVHALSAGGSPPKTADNELVPVGMCFDACSEVAV